MLNFRITISEILNGIELISVTKDVTVIDTPSKITALDTPDIDLKYVVGNEVCIVFDVKDRKDALVKKIVRCGKSSKRIREFVAKDYGGGMYEINFETD